MNLTCDEKKFYESTFHQLTQNGRVLDEPNCRTILTYGISDELVCDKVWSIVSNKGRKRVIKKQDLFRMLKYIAAYQAGYDSDEFPLENLPELSLPIITERSKETREVLSDSTQPDSNKNNSQLLECAKNITAEEDCNLVRDASPELKVTDNKQSDEKDVIQEEETKENVETSQSVLESVSNVSGSPNIMAMPDNPVEIPNFEDNEERISCEKLTNPFKVSIDHDQSSDKTTAPNSEKESRSRIDSFSQAGLENEKDLIAVKYANYLEQNQKFDIKIMETKIHNSGIMGFSTYVTYLIQAKYKEKDILLETERRYSDFDWLNWYLRNQPQYKGFIFPVLPEKKTLGNIDPTFIQQRRIELERYLKELARHVVLSRDPVLRLFLGERGREDFQALKERKPMSGIMIPELDWQWVKETCEYALVSMKVKLKEKNLPNEWHEANEKINEMLKIDSNIGRMLKILQRKQDSYKSNERMTSSLNILQTKVMNRIHNEAYYAIGSLSSLLMARATNIQEDFSATDKLIKSLKVFKVKLNGFKKSYGLLISILQEIETNKELSENKHSKLFECRAENNDVYINTINREIFEIDKKIKALEKESLVVRDNLSLELNILAEQFELFLPDVLSEFNQLQKEQLNKFTQSWEKMSPIIN